MKILRIFISSPGDVGEERELARRVIQRLQGEFSGQVLLEPILWEYQPLLATATFQDQLPRPSQADMVVFVLWGRLGTRLPAHITRSDGTPYNSGTEFEFEEALNGYQQRGIPDLLVYRKTAQQVTAIINEVEVLERLAQKRAVEAFINRWFHGADGSFTAAFHPFEAPAQFEEILEEHLRKLIRARLPQLPAGAEAPTLPPLWQTGSPFRGLEIFDFEHALIFCGRTQAVSDVLNAMRRQHGEGRAFVLILGMSGGGKSSLVRAGVLPTLTRPNVIEGVGLWRRAILRPSDASPSPGNAPGDLCRGLAVALLRDEALPELKTNGTEPQELAQLLRDTPQAAVPLIKVGLSQAAVEAQQARHAAQRPEARLVLVVDQLEEIFTQEWVTPGERTSFMAALEALARSGHVWVIATLRSDFYARCSELPQLLTLKEGAGQYDLRPPTPAEISQMIRRPAQMAGLRFEEDPDTRERLDDVLRDAAARNPEAMPLLEFTLEELYKQRTAQGVLTFQAYRDLRGVDGALTKRAEDEFMKLPPEVQAALPSVLSALVSFGLGEEHSVTRKRVPLSVVAATPASQALVRAFVAARLFVTDRAADGTPVLSIAHEALLRHWSRVQEWLDENKEFLSTRARIAAAAALWREEGEAVGFLLPPGKPLAEAQALLVERRSDLSAQDIQYIEASIKEAKRAHRRKLSTRLASAGAVLMLVAAGIGYWDAQWRTHIEYYANFTKRWGAPEGIGRLHEEEMRQRSSTLRFTRRGRYGPVEAVQVVNGSGTCALQHTIGTYIGNAYRRDFTTTRECQYVFERSRATGYVSREKAYDRAGRLVWMFVYSADDMAHFTDRNGFLRPPAGSGAVYVRFSRSQKGFEEEIRFLAYNREPKPNIDGSFGMRIEYDDLGLPKEIIYLGFKGEPMRSKEGVAKLVLKHDERGNVEEGAYFDEQGQPTRHRDGNARWTARYDERGNQIEMAYFDEQGQPTRHRDGNARWTARYDEHGNQIEVAYFDEQGQPVRLEDGYAKGTARYDERGNQIEVAYFDEQGQPTRHKDGFAKWRAKYNARGMIDERRYSGFDAANLRYSEVIEVFDDRGYVTERIYFGPDGHPTRNRDGYTKVVMKYDERGNLAEMAFLNEQDQLTHHTDGYAKLIRVYDDRGNPVEETYLDEQGRSTRHRQGYSRFAVKYDADGNIAQRHWLGFDPESFKFAEVVGVYDHQGNEVERVYFDGAGKPVQTKVIILNVLANGQGQRLGLRPGDIILSYDGKEVVNTLMFQNAVRAPGGHSRALQILRDGRVLVFQVAPGLIGIELGDRVPPTIKPADLQLTGNP